MFRRFFLALREEPTVQKSTVSLVVNGSASWFARRTHCPRCCYTLRCNRCGSRQHLTLSTCASRNINRACRVNAWQIPAKSPDLNPVERFWSWLRKQLRLCDMADLKAGRPVPGRLAYLQRVRNILRSARAQTHAAACVQGLRRVCKEIVLKRVAASHG